MVNHVEKIICVKKLPQLGYMHAEMSKKSWNFWKSSILTEWSSDSKSGFWWKNGTFCRFLCLLMVFKLFLLCQTNLILWKKIIYLVKIPGFTICRALATLTKIWLLWKRKKDSLENTLKCFSGPEIFKMGKFFEKY